MIRGANLFFTSSNRHLPFSTIHSVSFGCRAKRRLTLEEFDLLTDKLQHHIKFLYFHLMGEPFLHPLLPDFIKMARRKGFVPVLTTNGTLLSKGDVVMRW